ncbi:amidohydrolase family protein [Paraliomyxa miuraensis]|uniref:amidohydrolase family protein n=1 Tax=Paraliomyxa miuraensis TaxID=376150 RepID=UPI00224D7F0A|nr:amidohydrolase family protein [Paraliomyxa miuraensis]MCX4246065.1 amidohydrolase family protein [Paraliomyxa miuraensis]
MDSTFPIIDPHIHLWDPGRQPRIATPFVKLLGWNADLLHTVPRLVLPEAVREFVGRTDYLVAPYLPPDYAADVGHHQVEGYVYVEASWMGRGRMAQADETRWAEALGRQHERSGEPRLLGIVAAADLRRPDLARLLQAHRDASDRLCGIRDKLAWSPTRGVMDFAPAPALMGDPAWRRGFSSLADHDLSFDAWIYLEQANALVDLVRAYPRVRVIVDHLVTPVAAGGPFAGRGLDEAAQAAIRAQWRDVVARLAEHPQVSVKLSGMFMPPVGWDLHGRSAPVTTAQVRDALAPFVEHALACFGVERCMFASNFPMDKVSLGFERLYDAYRELVAGRPLAEQRALFHDNALACYRLSRKDPPP